MAAGTVSRAPRAPTSSLILTGASALSSPRSNSECRCGTWSVSSRQCTRRPGEPWHFRRSRARQAGPAPRSDGRDLERNRRRAWASRAAPTAARARTHAVHYGDQHLRLPDELDHQVAEREQLHSFRALPRLACREGLDAVDVEVELLRAKPLDQGCELRGVGVGKGLQLKGPARRARCP